MSVLEDRYRRVLRLLPASYRRDREEEMVATFLETRAVDDPDEAEYLAEFGRVPLGEVASVAALAARVRLGGPDAGPASFLWGEAVRRVALVVVLAHGALAVSGIGMQLWLSGAIGGPPVPDRLAGVVGVPFSTGWSRVLGLSALAWLCAFFALVWGRRRAAVVLVGLAFCLSSAQAVVIGIEQIRGQGPPGLQWWVGILLEAAQAVTIVAFHQDAPAVPRRPWLVALAAGVGIGVVLELVFVTQLVTETMLLDWPGVACLVLVVATAIRQWSPAGRVWRNSDATVALALLAILVLVQRGTSLLDLVATASYPGRSLQMTMAVTEGLVVTAVAIWLVAVAGRLVRAASASQVEIKVMSGS